MLGYNKLNLKSYYKVGRETWW